MHIFSVCQRDRVGRAIITNEPFHCAFRRWLILLLDFCITFSCGWWMGVATAFAATMCTRTLVVRLTQMDAATTAAALHRHWLALILIVWVVYCYELNALRRNGLSEKYWCVQVYVYALSQRSHLSFGVDPSVMHTVYTSIIYQYFPVVITMIIIIILKCHAPERENKLLNKERHCSNIKLLCSNALFGGLHLLHSQFHWIRNDSHEHMEPRLCTSIRAHRSTVYIGNNNK